MNKSRYKKGDFITIIDWGDTYSLHKPGLKNYDEDFSFKQFERDKKKKINGKIIAYENRNEYHSIYMIDIGKRIIFAGDGAIELRKFLTQSQRLNMKNGN